MTQLSGREPVPEPELPKNGSSINLIKNRPAETAMPIATVIAALIAKALGVEDTDTIFYIALVLSFIPAAVTWCVELAKRKHA